MSPFVHLGVPDEAASQAPDAAPSQTASHWRGWCDDFETVYDVRALDGVRPVIQAIQAAAEAGKTVVMALAYEAAPAFDDALVVHPYDPQSPLPLLWAGVCDDLRDDSPPAHREHFACGPWRPLVKEAHNAEALAAIHGLIRQGETYQVNYTAPWRAAFHGDPCAWFATVARAAQVGYPAFVDTGGAAIASFSPELFLRVMHTPLGRQAVARPMKGTMPRGRWLEEDQSRADALFASDKERAENVMIVDLLRNDLGRVAVPGGVKPSRLFQLEAYPTVWQMTSTVSGLLREDVTLWDLLAATFPCGSVTGAPKVRAMEIIRAMEPHPRGVYCGAIGVVTPDPRHGWLCRMSVPIRTAVVDRSATEARCSAGGGVVHDSLETRERRERAAKLKFLTPPPPFELLETLLLDHGRYLLAEEHLARMKASAHFFGFRHDARTMRESLDAIRREHPEGRWKVRMTMDRAGAVAVTTAALSRPGGRRVLRTALAETPVDGEDVFLCHKTTHRRVYEDALAKRPDCDDVLLHTTRGLVSEACLANVVVDLEGELVTPAREVGLLNGVYREALLRRGVVREAPVTVEALQEARRIWLVNSVRRWMPVRLVE